MIRYLYVYIIIQVFFLIGCSSSEEMSESDLAVNKEVVDFNNKSGSQNVTVITNVGNWTAKADKSWCRLSINGKIIRIEVDESEERLVREALVTVLAGTQTKQIKVRQLGYEAAILIDKQVFDIQAVGGDIEFNVTTNVKVGITLPSWIKEKTATTRAPQMVTSNHQYTVVKTTQEVKREAKITVAELLDERATERDIPITAFVNVAQHGLNEYSGEDSQTVNGDIKINVVSGSASSYQSGEEIEKSFDGDFTTIYHSNWNNSSDSYFPITLTYNFEQPTDVDYLVYSPRMDDAKNGLFKEVEIQYSENGSNFVKLADKDFKGLSTATRYMFDRTIRAKSFRFIVRSGAGDGRGFASCSEMEFYAKNPSLFDYSTLFTDATCSELKTGITEQQIDQCEYPFFKNLAYYFFKGTYPREFRIATFNAYPYPEIQAGINKTSTYSLLDNPTGISVKAGETLIVLVGNTHRKEIGLRVQNLDKPGADGFGGITYSLKEGINKLVIQEKGLAYVMYHTETLNDPTALPIKIHFASGTVNGYYDSQKHTGRWNELLGKATDKYFDVLGQYAHLTFETADFKRYAGTTGSKLIDLYDDFVYKQGLLLGLFKHGGMFRNRMYLCVMYKAYMHASSYHTAYNQNTMSGICDPEKLKTTDVWGPAHEIGHINQTRPGINWVGTGEVTNNIMSQYIQTTVFNQPSRIQTEDMGRVYRNRYSKAWNGIIANQRAHADFVNIGNDANDVFCKLVPFWQLELYFGKVLGKSPLHQVDKGGFYPDVYEYARMKNYNGMTNGEIQLDFVYNCCLAAKTNLLDFFEKWGFFVLIDKEIDDYGRARMTVTQRMVDALKAKVNALGFPKPDTPLEYISDNTVDLFKTKPGIVRGANASRAARDFVENGVSYQGTDITIPNWQNVVTYEVHNAAGRTIFIGSGENFPSNTDSFTLPVTWENGFRLFAVSASGVKVEIPVN